MDGWIHERTVLLLLLSLCDSSLRLSAICSPYSLSRKLNASSHSPCDVWMWMVATGSQFLGGRLNQNP